VTPVCPRPGWLRRRVPGDFSARRSRCAVNESRVSSVVRNLWSWTCIRTGAPDSKNPLGQIVRLNFSERRRKQNREFQQARISRNDFQAPVEILARREHEFQLVIFREVFDLVPAHVFFHAAAGGFDVDDLDDAWIEAAEFHRERRLHHDGLTAREECGRECLDRRALQQRFATCNFDERAADAFDFGHDGTERNDEGGLEREARIAPRAAQIALGETHERARAMPARVLSPWML
jgi:hypothetical protein